MRWRALALAAGLAAGCAPPPAAPPIRVFAAASLAGPFEAIAAAFERAHPGQRVDLHTGGSPQLVLQIREGAGADVFAAADEPNMAKVHDAGLTAAAPAPFAQNRLAILVPPGNPRGVRGLADLAAAGLRVALCGPEVPAGRYARLALRRAGVSVASQSDEPSVTALCAKLRLGELDAAIGYATDAVRQGLAAVPLPPEHDVVAVYPVAPLRGGAAPAGGAAFAAFLAAPAARAILAEHGFLPP